MYKGFFNVFTIYVQNINCVCVCLCVEFAFGNVQFKDTKNIYLKKFTQNNDVMFSNGVKIYKSCYRQVPKAGSTLCFTI